MLGEGAGVFVLERKDFADARGAAAHADVLGWGVTNDAHHPTTPRPDGEGARDCHAPGAATTPAWRPATSAT